MSTLAHYEQVLSAVGEDYRILPLQGSASLLITRRGARVLGVFPSPDAENLLWTSRAFDSVDSFRAFTTRTDGWSWNLGGDRCWVAPEINYNVQDRRDFGGTWHIPAEMDPGNYHLTEDHGTMSLTTEMRLTAYAHGAAIGTAHIHTERVLHLTSNPLARHPAMTGDVVYLGYEQQVTLKQLGDQLPVPSEIWNLVQLNAGGTLIIPVLGEVAASDYVGDVPAFARTTHGGVLHLPLNGKHQFKLGYKSLCMTGRMGYLHDLPDGRAYLLVRNYFNDPANFYAEEPPDQPGNTGHSVHIYNDGGGAGNGRPFCEMECSGRTLGTFDGFARSAASDTFSLWAYVGARTAIDEIALALVGSST